MKIFKEMNLREFEFWSGARDTVKYLSSSDLDVLTELLEDLYPEGIDETTVNDLFWFEEDWIAEMLGYEDFEKLMEDKANEEG